jgi:hypothetical protein
MICRIFFLLDVADEWFQQNAYYENVVEALTKVPGNSSHYAKTHPESAVLVSGGRALDHGFREFVAGRRRRTCLRANCNL